MNRNQFLKTGFVYSRDDDIIDLLLELQVILMRIADIEDDVLEIEIAKIKSGIEVNDYILKINLQEISLNIMN